MSRNYCIKSIQILDNSKLPCKSPDWTKLTCCSRMVTSAMTLHFFHHGLVHVLQRWTTCIMAVYVFYNVKLLALWVAPSWMTSNYTCESCTSTQWRTLTKPRNGTSTIHAKLGLQVKNVLNLLQHTTGWVHNDSELAIDATAIVMTSKYHRLDSLRWLKLIMAAKVRNDDKITPLRHSKQFDPVGYSSNNLAHGQSSTVLDIAAFDT